MPSPSFWRSTWAYESGVIYGMTETLANDRMPRRFSICPEPLLPVGKIDKLNLGAQTRERNTAPV